MDSFTKEIRVESSGVLFAAIEIPIAGFTPNPFKYPNLTFVGDPAAGQISQRSIPTGMTLVKKFIINFDKTCIHFDKISIHFELLDGTTYDIRGNDTINGKADRSGWSKRQATLILISLQMGCGG
ncbi:hypothetical protein B0H65DRAFT_551659 [Neurospora tetraspora]|uniref:Uncharacterized protein n=1 Tax=Neurospora tetraspora TaxID=94610 RepID=A0AAE0MPM8_9PEZI|nr:hypothetical protein B0H65DRAFT_551659 [Neurospora tetraspora]